jgi:hypothetical protein
MFKYLYTHYSFSDDPHRGDSADSDGGPVALGSAGARGAWATPVGPHRGSTPLTEIQVHTDENQVPLAGKRSAVKTASIHNVDNRIMYTIGVAAKKLGLLDADVILGIPLSATSKNIYFDRVWPPRT